MQQEKSDVSLDFPAGKRPSEAHPLGCWESDFLLGGGGFETWKAASRGMDVIYIGILFAQL